MYKPLGVLVLESNETHARIISRILRNENCPVFTAGSMMNLSSAGKGFSPQAVFIDTGFGGGAVAQVASQLKSRWPDAVMVVMSTDPTLHMGQIAALRDRGARIVLRKPFNQTQAAEVLTDIRSILAYGERRRHVVVVDDSEQACRTTAALLRAFDIKVSTCQHGEETFSRLAQEEVDVVLTDMNMPGMPGQDVIRKLRTSWKDVGIVAMSADERPHGPLSEAVRLGADAIIAKPFGAEAILGALGKAMQRPDPNSVFV